jgi:hypothetical protein
MAKPETFEHDNGIKDLLRQLQASVDELKLQVDDIADNQLKAISAQLTENEAKVAALQEIAGELQESSEALQENVGALQGKADEILVAVEQINVPDEPDDDEPDDDDPNQGPELKAMRKFIKDARSDLDEVQPELEEIRDDPTKSAIVRATAISHIDAVKSEVAAFLAIEPTLLDLTEQELRTQRTEMATDHNTTIPRIREFIAANQ